MTAIADTGFIVAVGNRNDQKHLSCTAVYRKEDAIYLPQSVISEVGYMLKREAGLPALNHFLRRLPEMKYRPIAIEFEDFARTADILEKYADARLDFVDATIVAVAERLNITRILTIDRRDFALVRPAHTPFFELLP